MSLVDKILQERFEASEAKVVVPDELVKNLQKRFGVKKRYRAGDFGIIWIGNNNRIIKITVDIHEAKVAAKLVGVDNPHYANIYAVYRYPFPKSMYSDRFDETYVAAFIIIKEHIQPFEENEKHIIEKILMPYLRIGYSYMDV
jgi:mRNA-degrading endonuclease RelE of RelBE toxin-antitoxin system